MNQPPDEAPRRADPITDREIAAFNQEVGRWGTPVSEAEVALHGLEVDRLGRPPGAGSLKDMDPQELDEFMELITPDTPPNHPDPQGQAQ